MCTPHMPGHGRVGQRGDAVDVVELPGVAMFGCKDGKVHTLSLGSNDPMIYSRAQSPIAPVPGRCPRSRHIDEHEVGLLK